MPESIQKEMTNEKMIERMRELISDESPTWDKKTKKNVK
jgi:hypothetical protein